VRILPIQSMILQILQRLLLYNITNLYSSRYDWDAATAANFLRKYGLIGNIYLYSSFKCLPRNQKMGVVSF
jgi:hypothetical protein